jgi:asparagine synthetase B (glutamine-hydrolysing)
MPRDILILSGGVDCASVICRIAGEIKEHSKMTDGRFAVFFFLEEPCLMC